MRNSILGRVALLVAALVLSSCASYRAYTSFNDAEALSDKGRYDEAIPLYQRAVENSPKDQEYSLRLHRARDNAASAHYLKGKSLMDEGKLAEAEAEFRLVLVYDQSYKRALGAMQDIRVKREASESYDKAKQFFADNKFKDAYEAAKRAYTLVPSMNEARDLMNLVQKQLKMNSLTYELDLKSVKPVTLKFKDAQAKDVFEVLAKLSGVNFLIDDAIRDTKVTVFIQDASFIQALELILFTSKLGIKVINPRNAVIFPDTKQKRKEYEETYIRTFFVKSGDAKKIANTVRSIIEARQLFVNEDKNAIIIRADEDSLVLAGKVIEANDITTPEVVLELEFIEVNRNDSEKLGIDVNPYSISAGFGKGSNPSKIVDSNSLSNATPNLITWRDLEVSKINRNILFTIPYLTLNFMKQQGVTKTLANPQIRALDSSKAQIHVGDRVPVITVTVSGADQRSENVQYVDVGVKFNAEPKILSNDEIELKVEAEVSNIISQETTKSGTTVYRIGTRNAKTQLRLRDGETTVLGGLIQQYSTRSKTGLALLSDIPFIGGLFSSFNNSGTVSDIYISITPRVARGIAYPPSDVTNIWSGAEDKLSSRPLLQAVSDMPVPVPAGGASQPRSASIAGAVDGAIRDENVLATPIGPDELAVGQTDDFDILLNGIPQITEFEIAGSINPAFVEPVSAEPASLGTGENDTVQFSIDSRTGMFSGYGRLEAGITGTVTVGTIKLKGRNKVTANDIIVLRTAKIRTKDGKVLMLRVQNKAIDVK